jgi:5-methylcytosine-specific restriction endonuclease McrA
MNLATSPSPSTEADSGRYRLEHVHDDALHCAVKTLVGRKNVLTADLLAHLAEVEARGIYRERACSSLYMYCIYELRLSEDEAQRRARAARAAREFPILFGLLAEGAIHLTGLLLIAPHLTTDNHADLLARTRFRTKREIEKIVAELAPRPSVPARIEPLGPCRSGATNQWRAYVEALRGPVRNLVAGCGGGQAPPPVYALEMAPEGSAEDEAGEAHGAHEHASSHESGAPERPVPYRYRVEFTATQTYVDLLEEARNLLQHRVPDRDVARVHELAMAAFVGHLRKRRHGATDIPRQSKSTPGSNMSENFNPTASACAPARVDASTVSPAWSRENCTHPRPAGQHPASVSCRSTPAPARIGLQAAAPMEATQARSSSPSRLRSQTSSEDANNRNSSRGRYVPAEVRRAVWKRDAGCCTFTGLDGSPCHERAGLEFHHERAFALGGLHTLENLRLLCRAHNSLLAERELGRAFVNERRQSRTRDPAADIHRDKRS